VSTTQGKSKGLKSGIPIAQAALRAALPRKRVRADELIPLELNDRERQLILEHTFADEELTGCLHVLPRSNERPVYHFTLADWDDLLGYVAAEANHTKNRKLQKEFDRLYARIADLLDSCMVEEK
jgi:hypothetical protein